MRKTIKRLIIFLIRKRLGLKKFQKFRFAEQESKYNEYYFTADALMKVRMVNLKGRYNPTITPSHVSLNWLLDDECQIKKRGENGYD